MTDGPQTDLESGAERPAPETQPDGVRDAPQTSSNQRQTEPVPPSPASPPPDFVPGGAQRDPDEANATEPGLGGVADAAASAPSPNYGAAPDAAAPEVAVPDVAAPPVPSPGFLNDEHGHVAVSTRAAQGTSEEMPAVDGIKTTAIAQSSKPDGEVAT